MIGHLGIEQKLKGFGSFLYFVNNMVYDPNHDLQETNRVVSNV